MIMLKTMTDLHRKDLNNEQIAQVITALTAAVLSEPVPSSRAQIAAELRAWLSLAEKLHKRRRKPVESETRP